MGLFDDEYLQEMLRKMREAQQYNQYNQFDDDFWDSTRYWYETQGFGKRYGYSKYPPKVLEAKQKLEKFLKNSRGIHLDIKKTVFGEVLEVYGFARTSTATGRSQLSEAERIEIFVTMAERYIQLCKEVDQACRKKPARCSKCNHLLI